MLTLNLIGSLSKQNWKFNSVVIFDPQVLRDDDNDGSIKENVTYTHLIYIQHHV